MCVGMNMYMYMHINASLVLLQVLYMDLLMTEFLKNLRSIFINDQFH
jgi:hypothetical protein